MRFVHHHHAALFWKEARKWMIVLPYSAPLKFLQLPFPSTLPSEPKQASLHTGNSSKLPQQPPKPKLNIDSIKHFIGKHIEKCVDSLCPPFLQFELGDVY